MTHFALTLQAKTHMFEVLLQVPVHVVFGPGSQCTVPGLPLGRHNVFLVRAFHPAPATCRLMAPPPVPRQLRCCSWPVRQPHMQLMQDTCACIRRCWPDTLTWIKGISRKEGKVCELRCLRTCRLASQMRAHCDVSLWKHHRNNSIARRLVLGCVSFIKSLSSH